MDIIIQLLIFLLAGYGGFLLFRLIHAPTPALLGSMCVFGALNCFGYLPQLPVFWVASIGQYLIGIVLASKFDRQSVKLIKTYLMPVFITTVVVFLLSGISGIILYSISPLDPSTALIASAAGGLPEMLALGESLGADTVAIGFVQLSRLIVIMIFVPIYVKRKIGCLPEIPRVLPQGMPNKPTWFSFALLLIVALGLAIVFRYLKVPAPIILGSLIGALAISLGANIRVVVSQPLTLFAFFAIGYMTGASITPESLAQFPVLFLPLVLTTVFMIGASMIFANFLHKFTKWDLLTCQLACAPGGLMQLAITATEMGANITIITLFHSVRILAIVFFWPFIVRFIIY